VTTRIDRRRAATRNEILDAAWDLAAAEGLAGIAMRPLASAVGMQAPSLYEYFPSKDAIYDAMFAEGNRELAESYVALPDPADVGAREALIASTRAFIEFCNENEPRFTLMFQRSIPGWRPSDDAYQEAVDNLRRLDAFLECCGITDMRSRDLWTAIVTGLASQQVTNDPGGDRWLTLIDETVDMFLAARVAT